MLFPPFTYVGREPSPSFFECTLTYVPAVDFHSGWRKSTKITTNQTVVRNLDRGSKPTCMCVCSLNTCFDSQPSLSKHRAARFHCDVLTSTRRAGGGRATFGGTFKTTTNRKKHKISFQKINKISETSTLKIGRKKRTSLTTRTHNIFKHDAHERHHRIISGVRRFDVVFSRSAPPARPQQPRPPLRPLP